MKFASIFDAALQKEEYPREWLDSAISYRQLKKCIKRVQQELQGLGLDPETLRRLWEHVEGTGGSFSEEPSTTSKHADLSGFRPKLTVAVDPHTGSPIDAWLSPQTRQYLQDLAKVQQLERRRTIAPGNDVLDGVESAKDFGSITSEGISEELETVEVPLTSDSEFFQLLGREMDNLDHLQETEHNDLCKQIVGLGRRLNDISDMSSKKSRKETYAWREIFRLYIESQIFFSSNEQDAGARTSQQASTRFQEFAKALTEEQQQKSVKMPKNAKEALDGFMNINLNLLRFMKFQEINRTALAKIMKKFDKRTALRAQSALPMALARSPFVIQDLAKATCFTISKELLTVVPQLNDYLCPICFSISFKPIRLRCKHVFCIRCMIVMQRSRQDHCPLCRGEVVMESSKCKHCAFLF